MVMKKTESVQSWYKNNIAEFDSKCQKKRDTSKELSLQRLIVFLIFLALLAVSIQIRSELLLLGTAVVFAIVFGRLVNVHNRVRLEIRRLEILSTINQHELDRLSLNLHHFDDGATYQDSKHSYCLDLDLFGTHSLFQWLNRTISTRGEQLLAKLMLNPPQFDEIPIRQQSVKELSNRPDWSQKFIASGLVHKPSRDDSDAFVNWVNSPTQIPGWFKPALMILPALFVIAMTGFLNEWWSGYFVLAVMSINGWLLYRVKPMADQTYEDTHRSIKTLKAYEAMISQVELAEFKSDMLIQLKRTFQMTDGKASDTINQLKQILSRIEIRNNGIYWIFNFCFLFDLIWLKQASSWKSKYSQHISHWFGALAEFEVLISISLTAHSQQSYTFPKLSQEGYRIKATDLGHPMIPEVERVTNNFSLDTKGSVVVLTGSNMSGKSTFLRTVGVNVVLARMGSVVCSREFEIGDFKLFTSMRTTDSLEQHVSSFYAELERIKTLIQILSTETPTLYLLDELLKGTNSQDRNLGSTALIKQLVPSSAFGIISTHDLALGALADQLDKVRNYSFNCDLSDGHLRFDYKLSPGLCKSFNASELMAQMGIDLKSEPAE